MIFPFKKIGVMKLPWGIFAIILIVLLGYTIYNEVYDPIPPILIGIFIIYIFSSLAQAKIEVRNGVIIVKMGILTNFSIPIEKIEKIDLVKHLFIQGIGIRVCGKSEIAVVTATGQVVRLNLKSKGSLRVFNIIPISFKQLRLSPEDPERFVATVNQYKTETGRI